MNILLTGGTGYIGSHIAVELINAGHNVVILDNLSNSEQIIIERLEKITGRKIIFRKVDIRDREKLDTVFLQYPFDVCMHFAGLKSVNDSIEKPLEYYQNNVYGTIVLLEVMKKHNVKKMIFSSSATVYGDTNQIPMKETQEKGKCSNPYGRTKSMIEDILIDMQNSDPDWKVSILRYFNPVGAHKSGLIGEKPNGIPNNLMPYITQTAIGLREKLSIFGSDYDTADGTAVRDFIHVVDLAKGHLKALEHINDNGNKIFNLGTGKGTSVLELVTTFEKVNELKLPYSFENRREGDIPVCYADCTKANMELNWKAELTIEDMCRDAWRWEQQLSTL